MEYSKFTIILPIINEKATLGMIIQYINTRYKGAKVVVADDGSTDGSKELVLNIARKNENVKLLDRKKLHRKRGLTSSIIDAALSADTKYIIVMDADMQHPPAVIKEIAKMLGSGFDIVIATRAAVPGWKLYRKIISVALMSIGYIILLAGGRQTSSDIFSGYFGTDRAIFTGAVKENRRRFVGEGYKILFDFLKCTRKGSLKVVEVPYVFDTRKGGKSKAGLKQGFAVIKSFLT